MDTTPLEKGEWIIRRHNALAATRTVYDAFWQNIANYVQPRKAFITRKTDYPSVQGEAQLYDSTAVLANEILANGHMAWMTPVESIWFSYDPPTQLQGIDSVKQWFAACSEITRDILARSNFYSEIHELYLDRGAFGTGILFCEPGQKSPITFTNFEIGTYSITENSEGYVDTISREFEFTLRQAAEKFGVENLSPKLQKELKQYDAAKQDRKYKFVHAIYPRDPEEIEDGKRDGKNKPYASCYVELGTKHLVRESGFDELPFFATRYLKWGKQPYGWSPSWIAVPEARQLNFLEEQMDSLAELKAFPRFLLPYTHDGDVDFRAGGLTYFDSNIPNAKPQEWATAGDYNTGKDRAEIKRQAINRAYHVDLFQMFSDLEKQMTATEVQERASEKMIQFSPTFARLTTELYGPMLRRVFNILAAQNLFPPPPREAVVSIFHGELVTADPEISYSSRIALADKQLANSAFSRVMQMLEPAIQMNPSIMDNYDWDTIARDVPRNVGLPAAWLMDAKMRDQVRQQRAQAQQQAAQQQQLASGADAAQKIGSVKNNSVAAQLLRKHVS